MNNVALFDFCETIANFQTADAYVDFVRERLHDKRMIRYEYVQNCLRKIKAIQLLDKITGNRYSINKRLKLWQLRGHDQVELSSLAKAYYKEQIKPNFIPDVLDELIKYKNQDFSIIIVSGGYDLYLNFFAEDYGVTDVISTKIAFTDGKCKGTFDGIDCLGNGKITLLNQYFGSKPDFSIAFSDSISDLPFLKWVDVGYVISRITHQIWSTNNKLKEIIWIPKK